MPRRSRRTPQLVEPKPWTAEEDASLADICRIGLSSDYWTMAIPGRSFGEIAERRHDLKLELKPLI